MPGAANDTRAGIDQPTRRRLNAAPRRRQMIGALGAAIALILLTASMSALGSAVSLPSILLLFLIVVVGASAVGGFWPAIGTAVASFLLVNWFFTPPVHTFIIARGEHWIALVVFVVVGVFVAGVVEVAVRRAAEAAQSRDEAQKLARLAGMAPVESLLAGLVQEFHLDGASVIGRDANGGWGVRGSSGTPVSASDTTGSLAVDADHTLLIAGSAFPPARVALWPPSSTRLRPRSPSSRSDMPMNRHGNSNAQPSCSHRCWRPSRTMCERHSHRFARR